MIKATFILIAFVATFGLGCYITQMTAEKSETEFIKTQSVLNQQKIENMKLGAFSVSLSVKDLAVSKEFYEKLGFKVLGGSMDKNYLIMKNENSLIGLFQGMFQGNILTFNPGWDENGQNIENFDDIREIQKQLKNQAVQLTAEADENTSGPASIMFTDPDGNMILIDQHR